MSMNLVTLLYLVASVCFIQALKGLSHPTTSIRGNVFGMTGMTIAVGGISFAISGALRDQDSFTLGPNAAGVSDSRNAIALGQVQTTKLLLSADGQPSATLQSVYSQLVSSVGNKSREAQVNRDAQESLVSQATEAQQSVAGVNLDEEAANLIRYQQAYQASSKVMTIASKLFDEVLALGR